MSISSIGADADDEVKSHHHNIMAHTAAAGVPTSDQTDATASVVSSSDGSDGGDMTSDQPSTNGGVETVLLTKSATGITVSQIVSMCFWQSCTNIST